MGFDKVKGNTEAEDASPGPDYSSKSASKIGSIVEARGRSSEVRGVAASCLNRELGRNNGKVVSDALH